MSEVTEAATRGAVTLLDSLTGPRLSVLILHRVQPRPDPLFPHEMHAARFDELMRWASRCFNVLTLGEAAHAVADGGLPPRAMSITFDDGYADNAEVALPILLRHGLRATFFVSTGFLDGGRMWNDTVIESLRNCALDEVDLQELGLERLPLRTDGQRRAAIDLLLPRIKYLSLPQREEALLRLQRACGDQRLPDALMMSSSQVLALHAAGMEIGGHTVHHPILTEVSDDVAKLEIVEGRRQLQTITGAAVDVFAYPNGRPVRDYGWRHVEMVREAGFRCAVSTASGVVRAGSDPLQWQRFTPWDLSGFRWKARLLRSRYQRPAPVVGADQP